jgi:hypothetical protein
MSKKLLRLHTIDQNSIFDCVFNEEIKVNPYSEIALHSASFPISNRFLVVDATNDSLTYQVQAEIHNIDITHGTYTKFNATRLLETISDDMNKDLDITNAKEHGTEISVNMNNDTRVAFEFGYASQLVVSSGARDSGSFFKSDNITVGSRGNNIKLSDPAQQSPDNDAGYIIGEVPFIRGCGNIKLDLTHYQVGDGSAVAGITMGLIPKSLWDIYKAGRGANVDGTSVDNSKWKYFKNFSEPAGADNLTEGSKLSMDLTGGKIIFREYKQDNTVRDLKTYDFDYTDLGTELYYPAIIIHDPEQYIKVRNIKYTPSPFNLPPTIENTEPLEELSFGTLPLPFGRRPTIYNVIFGALSLRDYLGFSESNLNPENNTTVDRAGDRSFRANRHFTNITSSDNYMIEMLNIKLDSYDSFTPNNVGGGRKNILAPIPVSEQIIDNQTGLVQYEPNNFNFISLNNEYPLNLRNIRMRIIDFQHGTVLNSGFQSVNIIIRDSDKK